MFNTSMIKKNCKPVGSDVGAWVGSGIGAWVGFGTEIFFSKMTPKHSINSQFFHQESNKDNSVSNV